MYGGGVHTKSHTLYFYIRFSLTEKYHSDTCNDTTSYPQCQRLAIPSRSIDNN